VGLFYPLSKIQEDIHKQNQKGMSALIESFLSQNPEPSDTIIVSPYYISLYIVLNECSNNDGLCIYTLNDIEIHITRTPTPQIVYYTVTVNPTPSYKFRYTTATLKNDEQSAINSIIESLNTHFDELFN
jgi:hypothetical protein